MMPDINVMPDGGLSGDAFLPVEDVSSPAECTSTSETGSSVSGRAFGKEARLANWKNLDTVKKDGIKFAGRLGLLLVLKAPPDATRRAAFLISRRFDHLSVVRNRARRLYREVFRILYPELAPVWIVFIPKWKIKTAKMQDVLSETRRLLSEFLIRES